MSLTFKVNDDDDYPFLEFNINNQVKFKYCDLGDLEDWQTMKNSIQEGKDNSFGAGGNSCSGFEYSSDKEILKIWSQVSGSGGDSEFELNIPMKEGLDIVNTVINHPSCIKSWND